MVSLAEVVAVSDRAVTFLFLALRVVARISLPSDLRIFLLELSQAMTRLLPRVSLQAVDSATSILLLTTRTRPSPRKCHHFLHLCSHREIRLTRPTSSYFSEHDPGYKSYETSNGTIPNNGGIYNHAGRGYPDMSAAGDNGAFIIRGEKVLTGGTSMSAPLVAGLFTRINIERSKAGKPPIGFVNPTLYSHPEMFRDVTVGNQDKGGPFSDRAPSACGNDGFSAVKGWDPVTGMGTPMYAEMLKVFMSQ